MTRDDRIELTDDATGQVQAVPWDAIDTIGRALPLLAGESVTDGEGSVRRAATPEQRAAIAAFIVKHRLQAAALDPADASMLAAWYVTASAQRDPGGIHYQTARNVLGTRGIDEDRAVDSLARSLANACRDLAERVGAQEWLRELTGIIDGDDDECDRLEARAADLAPQWDEALAEQFEALDDRGRGYANDVRGRSAGYAEALAAELQQLSLPLLAPETHSGLLWGEYLDFDGDLGDVGHLCPALRRLADALWVDRVRGELEERRQLEQRKEKFVGALQTSIFDVLLRGSLAPGATVRPALPGDELPGRAGDSPRIVRPSDHDAEGDAVGWFHGRTVGSLRKADRALDHLRSPAGIALLCAGAETIAQQTAEGARSPTTTRHRGMARFASDLGVKVTDLHEILAAGMAYRSGDIAGLFTVGVVRPAPNQEAETHLTWSTSLFIGDRGLLTPTPDPRALPKFGSRMQRNGLFAWLLMHWHLGEQSKAYAEHDAAALPLESIRREAGIGRKRSWHGVLDVLRGERKGQGPYLLPGNGPDTFRLADPRRHNFLVEQGRRRERNTARGRARAEKTRRADGRFAKGKGPEEEKG
jgi:hypothetical protein